MKKVLLIAVAIVAMAGITPAEAQSCGDNSTYGTQGPCPSGSLCGCQSGRSDCAGPSCVNLQTNNNNCGSLGNRCDVGGGQTCSHGACICEWDSCSSGGDFGQIQPGANPANPPLAVDVPQQLVKRKRPHLS